MICFCPVNIDANLHSLEPHSISNNLLFHLHVIQKGNKRIRRLLMMRPNLLMSLRQAKPFLAFSYETTLLKRK